MDIREIINKKANGNSLSYDEINFFTDGIVKKELADYQISALITAMYINKLNKEEIFNLTKCMAYAGEMLDLKEVENTVDKHSTGGVGDKISLIVVPIMASLGLNVFKMSGRGLGKTGGTIDKLESIKGFNTNLSPDKFFNLVLENGCAITSQSGNMCYPDKVIYAIRDATGTVDNIGLIASSVMSKKIASGAKNIILDVKCGDGAFMKNIDEARKLSEYMVEIGKHFNRNTIAFITNMDEPLGNMIGNSVEVIEAVEVLKGKYVKGLTELSYEICKIALMLSGIEKNEMIALKKVKEVIENKSALKKFETFIKSQGGVSSFINDYSLLPVGKSYPIYSNTTGYIEKINSEILGNVVMTLGGGRRKKEDKIDYKVGIELHKKYQDKVRSGDKLLTLYCENEPDEHIKNMIHSAYSYSDKIPASKSIIMDIIS